MLLKFAYSTIISIEQTHRSSYKQHDHTSATINRAVDEHAGDEHFAKTESNDEHNVRVSDNVIVIGKTCK